MKTKVTQLEALVTKQAEFAAITNEELPSTEDYARQLMKEEGLLPAAAIQKVKDAETEHLLSELELEQVEGSIFGLCAELKGMLEPIAASRRVAAESATEKALKAWHNATAKLLPDEALRERLFAASSYAADVLAKWKEYAAVPSISLSNGAIEWRESYVSYPKDVISPYYSPRTTPEINSVPNPELDGLVKALKEVA